MTFAFQAALSAEHLHQILSGKDCASDAFSAEHILRKLRLLLLESKDSFFNGVLRNKLVNRNDFCLSDPVCAIARLVLRCRVPPEVEMNDAVRPHEVQPCSALLLHRDYFAQLNASLSDSFVPQGLFRPPGCIPSLEGHR